jgi:hypothetical protein
MIDIILTIAVGLALLFCGFLLGKGYWMRHLMDMLIENGFVKVRHLDDDNVELIRVDNRKNID